MIPCVIPPVIPKFEIMKYPTLRVIFDRKNVATATHPGLVQIEILSERRRKYISTGVKVYAGEWRSEKVVRRPDALDLNDRIDLLRNNINTWINNLIRNKETFDFEKLDGYLKQMYNGGDFIGFIEKRLEERNISESTKKTHRRIVDDLKEFGLIKGFSDITVNNIILYDEYLHRKKYMQTTVYGYHKRLKVYINNAIAFGLFSGINPYSVHKISRGISSTRKYLSSEEVEKIKNANIEDKVISNVRDCFIFCCFTGLAYSDLKKFNWNKDVHEENGKFVINDVRTKTKTPYKIVILSPALEILKKHNFELKVINNAKFNICLKAISSIAGINKNLTSHMARHTFATWALSQGVKIENVSKMLAHTSVRTTEIYAKVLSQDVMNSYNMLEEKIENRSTEKTP